MARTRSSFLRAPADRVGDRQLGEECLRVVAQPLDRLDNLVLGGAVLDAAGRDQPFDVARELLDAVGADVEAEILRRDVLELVRLVEDRSRERRNDLAEGVLPDRGIGAQQVMVDDHDVGRRGALAHPRDEAVVVARALGAEAGVRRGRDLVPERQILGQILELRAIAGIGPRRPLADDRQEDVVDRRPDAVGQLIELVHAQVVRAALHVRRGERDPERVAQRGNVLEVDLLLQVLRAGRNQHALAAENCGHEVGERLAGAGAGLREQNAAVFEHAGDRRGHVDLAGARLEVGHGERERSARREDRLAAPRTAVGLHRAASGRARRACGRSLRLRVQGELPAQTLHFSANHRPARGRRPASAARA